MRNVSNDNYPQSKTKTSRTQRQQKQHQHQKRIIFLTPMCFFLGLKNKSSWWFQPTWKSQIGSFPQGSGVKKIVETTTCSVFAGMA